MIIDTHSHCYWDTLEPRIYEIISNMEKASVKKAIQIGCDISSSRKAIELARRFPGILYATVGFHPEEAQNRNISDALGEIREMEILIEENRDIIVAVGETGLDYHYLDGSHGGTVRVDMNNLSEKAREQIAHQKDWWLMQWKIAQKYNLPLVIHTRDARNDTLEYIKQNTIYRCVMHCFSEDWEFAQELLEFSDDIYFSFSGILTYKNTSKIREAASRIPLNRILIETDSPFLAPQIVRGRTNEPSYVRYILDTLIEIRSEERGVIESTIYDNSLRFYGLKHD